MFYLASQTASAGAAGPMPFIGMILYIAVIFGIMYFLLIRPQKKRQKQVTEMQSAVCVGDWIMTTGGLFGKVVDTVNEYLIVEFGTNKSVLIPMHRDQVASVEEPDLRRKKIEEEVPVEDDDDDLDDDDLDLDDEE